MSQAKSTRPLLQRHSLKWFKARHVETYAMTKSTEKERSRSAINLEIELAVVQGKANV